MGFSRAVASYFILPALSEDPIIPDLKKKPMTDFKHVFTNVFPLYVEGHILDF